jgi:proteasome accessory factor C
MSSALERMGRLLALVPWLQARDGITIQEAATHFNISAEQLERDLWLLVVCGVPGYGPDELIDIDFWDDGHIHVRDPLTLDQPMRLSGDEIAALSIALDAMAELPAASPGVLTAREKLRKATNDWQELAVDIGGSRVSGVVRTIDEALREGRSIDITYASGTTGLIDQRSVIPVSVATIDGRSVLDAYCRKADAVRTFRIDRILEAALGDAAIVPTEKNARPQTTHVVRCVLHPGAEWIADVHPVEVEPGSSGRIVRISVHDERWLVRLVLGLGGALEVLEPLSVRALVAQEAQTALTAYASPDY